MIRKILQALGLAPKPHPETLDLKYFRVAETLHRPNPRPTQSLGTPPTEGTAVSKPDTGLDMVVMGLILGQALDNGSTQTESFSYDTPSSDCSFPDAGSGMCEG